MSKPRVRLVVASSFFAFFLILSPDSIRSGEKWENQPPAQLVIGQPDFETKTPATSNAKFNMPWRVAIDPTTAKVFVSERGNNRILRFASFDQFTNGAAAEAVLGQDDFLTPAGGTAIDKLNGPVGIHVDGNGVLWVADSGNHRVLRFDGASAKANGADADGVLGQALFTTMAAATTQSGMNTPTGVYVDTAGRLWVADALNNRVLRFDNASAKGNGAAADGVLGQALFTTMAAATSQGGMNAPDGIAGDSTGRIWICDSENNRVLRFDNAAAKSDGANADGVLGQTAFNAGGSGLSGSALDLPLDVVADASGRIWVADNENNRVLRFDNAAAKANGANADGVIGQADFDSKVSEVTRKGLSLPSGLALEANGRLWIGDCDNHRVLAFEETLRQPDIHIGRKTRNQRGDDIYNRSGAGQKITVTVAGNGSQKIHLTVENDGNDVDNYLIQGSRPGRKFSIKVFRVTGGRKNVTGRFTRAGLMQNGVGAGEKVRFLVIVSGDRAFRGKAGAQTFKFTVRSKADSETDRGKSKVKKKR